jgi:diguanylate cyclase (GGDEF)-like protein
LQEFGNEAVSLLIIETSPAVRRELARTFWRAGISECLGTDSVEEAVRLPADRVAGVRAVLVTLAPQSSDEAGRFRRLRSHPPFVSVPILALVEGEAGPDRPAALPAAADDFLTLPVRVGEFHARLQAAERHRRESERTKAVLREREEELRYLHELVLSFRAACGRDELTGLANRRSFDTALRTEWGRAARDGAPLGLLMADVDHFKAYNDTYGHPAGDHCLARVADAIRGGMRRPADTAARYGGEEFALILPGTDLAGAVAVAETIRSGVAGLGLEHASSPVSRRVTVSVGVASIVPDSSLTEADLLSAADQALYRAKFSGRNRVGQADAPARGAEPDGQLFAAAPLQGAWGTVLERARETSRRIEQQVVRLVARPAASDRFATGG